MSVSLIISIRRKSNPAYFEKVTNEEYASLEEATSKGEKIRQIGVSVTIRPNYNESDENGSYFREWRSMNGEVFQEYKWYPNDNW